MTMNNNLQEILITLDSVRIALYPEIDSQILKQIIAIQYNNQEQDRRSIAKSETANVVKQYIESTL